MLDTIDLTGRVAKCSCGKTEASSSRLAFFQSLGDGSREATHGCSNCGYFDVAHTNEVRSRNPHICSDFQPKGDVGHDRYYCGHSGWD